MINKQGRDEIIATVSSCSKRRRLEAKAESKTVAQIPRGDHGRIRGRRGHLKLVAEMPFDVLYEIFGQLDPIDLLHLSWTTRTIHGILMAKNARFLWANAFARLYESDNPPPECPSDLNFAQYTRFLFGKRCMECEVNVGNHRSWSMRLRICRHCLHSGKFLRASKLEGPTGPPWWGLAMISSPHGMFFFKAEYDKARDGVRAMDHGLLAQHQEEWRKQSESAKWGELAYETWLHKKRQDRKEELCSLRAQRREAFLKRFSDLGWRDAEVCAHVLANSVECTKPKVLTQREWNILQPSFIGRLEEAEALFQNRRHRNKILFRLDVLQQRIDHICRGAELDEDERPFPEDIAVIEPFRSTIFRDIDDEPACLFMDDLQFAHIVLGWHYERKRYILSLLPEELVQDRGGNKVEDPLSLEVAYFCRNGSTAVQFYYQAICRIRESFGDLPIDAPREVLLLGLGQFRRPWQWDRYKWTFDLDRYRATTTMMIFLEMDPRLTKPGDFLSSCATVKLQCVQCKAEEDGGLRNCWSAVQHELEYHRDNLFLPGELKWRVA